MARYRRKPIVFEAAQYQPGAELEAQFRDCLCDCLSVKHGRCSWHIHTLEGPLGVSDGDWIIKGVNGEFHPCKPDIFEATYEAVE